MRQVFVDDKVKRYAVDVVGANPGSCGPPALQTSTISLKWAHLCAAR